MFYINFYIYKNTEISLTSAVFLSAIATCTNYRQNSCTTITIRKKKLTVSSGEIEDIVACWLLLLVGYI